VHVKSIMLMVTKKITKQVTGQLAISHTAKRTKTKHAKSPVASASCPVTTRHRASTSMYSLTFCVRFLLLERHQRKSAVQAAAVMLRKPPVTHQSAASSARRPRPAGRSHYVVISRDGRKLITRVRVMSTHAKCNQQNVMPFSVDGSIHELSTKL